MGTPAWPARSARRSWRGRRAPRAPPSTRLARTAGAGAPPPAPERGERLLVRAHRLSQGHGPGGAGARRSRPRHAPRSTSSSPASVAIACWWSCGTTAIPSTATATTRWRWWPMAAGVDVVATNNVHYATPAQRPLATALAAVRARRSLDEIDGWLPASPFAHLRSAGGAGTALRSLAGRGGAHGRDRARVRVRPAARRARAARSRRARRPHRDDAGCASSPRAALPCATRGRIRSTSRRCTRSRTSST